MADDEEHVLSSRRAEGGWGTEERWPGRIERLRSERGGAARDGGLALDAARRREVGLAERDAHASGDHLHRLAVFDGERGAKRLVPFRELVESALE